MSSLSRRPADAVVGQSIPHESAALHVTGAALYTDDLVGRTAGVLHAWPVQSPHARATVTALTGRAGIRRRRGRPRAHGRRRAGQSTTGASRATSRSSRARSATSVTRSAGCSARPSRRPGSVRSAVEVDYAPSPAIITVREAIAAEAFQGGQPTLTQRRRRARARPARSRSSRASSTSPGRSTSTSRRTRRWRSSTRPVRSSCSRAPSTRARPRRSSPTCWGCRATR